MRSLICLLLAVVAPAALAQREDVRWAATLERIAPAVVAIKVDQTRAFDTDWSSSSQATGFVIDAEQGLVLTNRHVVTPGPVVAEATFLNREEVSLQAVYRDPVHDFGLYRYDPSRLRFIRPPALPLHPQGAQVGREIRVIGNNAGEQLSILAGTLARLDREAPAYGFGKYNDFNTFYIQAASGTSGGSSGSPVIDIEGRVVALNAGGATGAASSFYLPLGRVLRAVELIRAGKPVTRGSLQTVFGYTPFDELRRLGLPAEVEAATRSRFPQGTGLLVVEEVLPGSPAHGVLQVGDILVRIEGREVAAFEPLEAVLDEAVDREVTLQVQRGGELRTLAIRVTDLESITPARYLEFGEAVVHELSYQQARHYNRAVEGVFVVNPGFVLGAAGVPRNALVTELNGRAIRTLDDFRAGLELLGDGDPASLRYTTQDDVNGSTLKSFRMERRWYPARECRRDDRSGLWPCTDLAPGPAPRPVVGGTTALPAQADPLVSRLSPSLVQVNFDMPYGMSGVTDRHYTGTGLIVDAARGWVVVDRNTVPIELGDARLTFGAALEIPAQVLFIHPLHNLALLAYDPALVGATPLRSARLQPRELLSGDAVTVIGLDASGRLKSRETRISSVDPLQLPLSRSMQFRESNLEVAQLLNPPNDFDGVVVDGQGRVLALWSSFLFEGQRENTQGNRGVPIDLVIEMLAQVESGQPLHTLDAELGLQSLADARRLGLSDVWVKRLEQANPANRRVLAVARLTGGAASARVLRQGDLLLAIDGAPVTRFRDVERRVIDRSEVEVVVWRDGGEQVLRVATTALQGREADRLVLWAGATLQAPHRAMSVQRGIRAEGVYVSYYAFGSPASRYRLVPGRRIVEVDGQPTPDLDAFLRVVAGRADRSAVRVRTLTWNNTPEIITLKLDTHYFPAYELRRGALGWERRALE